MKKSKTLIVGGGVGGLSTAIMLQRVGVAVDFIDIDPHWGALGAGITLTGPSLRALRELGVLDEVMAQAYTGEGIRVCDTQGNTLKLLDTPMPADAGVPGSGGMVRPALHAVLHQKMVNAGIQMRLGLTVDAFKELADAIEVTFSDGSTGIYDLVVGSDGVNSKVRKLIIPDAPAPEYTGQYAWRVTVPRPKEIDRRTYFLGGPHKVGITPTSDNEMYLFLLEKSPKIWREANALAAPLRALLKDYGGIVGQIRDNIKDDDYINFRPLEGFILPAPWYRGRVLLVGDAAHPTTPQLASGAGMAMEDGIVLADELVKAQFDVATLLPAYMARREPRCRLIVGSSMELGRLEQAHASIETMTAVVERTLALLMEPI
ncbi:MAG: FAD-dependent monooxygenase [Giesbergeria sp.]|uniref:FAD-dependent monooxygenase n=1 Tax=Giesbergeria sp. TaxID=2818473 RepID=UPI002615A1ED|nr:FAD-dependent monooxygenase [Giesbergeria sp.]MDD2610212.1 FAD-dependent monooxygenase [Giesbergeria sp.]